MKVVQNLEQRRVSAVGIDKYRWPAHCRVDTTRPYPLPCLKNSKNLSRFHNNSFVMEDRHVRTYFRVVFYEHYLLQFITRCTKPTEKGLLHPTC